MLVLSRKKGEQIRIGDDVVITVQRLSGNRVSIGIEAPAECRIVRGELQPEGVPPTAQADDEESRPQVTLHRYPRPITGKIVGENRIAEHLKRTLGAK